jgi:uridine kinase
MKQTIIGIAGGTASGKTTIAKKLYDSTKKLGHVALIKIDDYYYGKTRVPKDEDGN